MRFRDAVSSRHASQMPPNAWAYRSTSPGLSRYRAPVNPSMYTVAGSLSRPSPLSGDRRITNGPDISPGCSPALNGTTRRDTFGSSDTSASRPMLVRDGGNYGLEHRALAVGPT